MFNENRKFGLLVGGFLILITFYKHLRNNQDYFTLLTVGIILVLLAVVAPKTLTMLRVAWEKLGYFLGQINTIIMLTILYVLIITPIGIFNRIIGKDTLKVKLNLNKGSYWEITNSNEPVKLNQQF